MRKSASGKRTTVTMQSCETLELSEQEKIAFGINKVAKGLASALSSSVKDHGLTGLEANFLLKMHIGLKYPSAIASCMGIDASNLSRLIRRLEDLSFLTREVDNENRSRAIVKLTQKGRKKAAEVRPSVRRMEDSIMSTLTETDLKDLKRVLDKMCSTFQPQ